MNARKRRIPEYLDHMLEALKLARNYVEGFSKENFLADKKTQQAVILNIMVIGEAAIQILDECPEFTARYPDEVEIETRIYPNNKTAGGL